MSSKLINDYYKFFGNKIIFLDLETTGISCEEDHIIEIGAVKYKNNKEIDRFKTFVKTTKKLSSTIINLTGIKDEDLINAPELDDILEDFANFIGEFPIFAHNSEFEKKFLMKIFDGKIKNKFYDTCYFSCLVFPNLKSFSLENLMIEFGIKDYEMHRALDDALDAKEVMNFLIEEGLVSIPYNILKNYSNSFKPDDYMVRDMVLALKNVYDKHGIVNHQPFLNFNKKDEELEKTSLKFQEQFREILESKQNSILYFSNKLSHKANITNELSSKTNDRRSIIFISDYDKLENWKKYFDRYNNTGKKIAFVDKIPNYLCSSNIYEHIEKARENNTLTGFDFYMKILLSKNKFIQKNKIAPFLLFRENNKSPLLTTYSETRKNCLNKNCKSNSCIMREISSIFHNNDITVTLISNLYILDKYNLTDIMDQELIIFDNLEYLDKFYDENLESFSFNYLQDILNIIEEKIEQNSELFKESFKASLKITKKYLKKLKTFLIDELKNEKYRVAFSKSLHNYEEILCEFLDLYINLSNFYKKYRKYNMEEFWYINFYEKLSTILLVIKDFLKKSKENIKYLQLFDDNNIKVSLQSVSVEKSFQKLTNNNKKQIIITTGSGNNYKFREYMLNLTGLSNLGEFNYVNFSNNEYREIDLLIPENVPDLNTRNKNYLKKLKELIVKLVSSRKGKTILIMNSMARMKLIAKELEKDLKSKEILFLQQHIDGGKNKLIKVSKSAENVLIIGSQSFYTHLDSDEGIVDSIIVEKPPFPFFKDEFIVARREIFQDRGFNDFEDFIVPQTILKLKNGLRRLSNNGLFVIADSKISNNNYFKFVVETISPAEIYKSLESYTTFKLL